MFACCFCMFKCFQTMRGRRGSYDIVQIQDPRLQAVYPNRMNTSNSPYAQHLPYSSNSPPSSTHMMMY